MSILQYIILYREREFNRESRDAPEIFQILKKEKVDKYNKEIADKEETITLLSKNRNWITVTPKHRDRKKALENVKVKNTETSKILPIWMRPKYNNSSFPENMKSISYKSIRNGITTVQLVDKENINYLKNKSIFSFGDFRHNVRTKDECEEYQRGIMMEPKKFFDWDDGKEFNPKKKRDYGN